MSSRADLIHQAHTIEASVCAAARDVSAPGPVTTVVGDCVVSVETAQEFRASRGLVQCPRCFAWDAPARFTPTGRGKQAHACRWNSIMSRPGDTFQSGVDAWYGERRSRRSLDDAPDPMEA